MTQERIELRFSPGSPSEKALIDALSALGDEYGAKGRFLKERLLRGYAAMLRELDGFMQEGDPMAALDRIAATVDAKRYRVLKALLAKRVGGRGEVQSQDHQVPASLHVAEPAVLAPPYADPGSVLANVALDANAPVVPAAPAVRELSAQVMVDAPASDPDAGAKSELPAASTPARKHDWSAFAGIAGAKKGG